MSIEETLKEFNERLACANKDLILHLLIRLMEEERKRFIKLFDDMIQPQDSYDLGVANTYNQQIEYLQQEITHYKSLIK